MAPPSVLPTVDAVVATPPAVSAPVCAPPVAVREVVALAATPVAELEPTPTVPETMAEVATSAVQTLPMTVDRMAIQQWEDMEVLAATSKTVVPRSHTADAPLGRFEVRAVPRTTSVELDWGEVEVRHDVRLA